MPTLTVMLRDAPSSSSFFNSTYFSFTCSASVLSLAPVEAVPGWAFFYDEGAPAADPPTVDFPPFFSSAPAALPPASVDLPPGTVEGLLPGFEGWAPGLAPAGDPFFDPAAPATTFVTLTVL